MADRLLLSGLLGSAVVATCCVTPALPLTLGALGLGGWIPFLYRDAILLPLLMVCLAVTGYALWQRAQRR